MGYVSTGMGDCFSAPLVSLMALWLALVDRNPFEPCFLKYSKEFKCISNIPKTSNCVYNFLCIELWRLTVDKSTSHLPVNDTMLGNLVTSCVCDPEQRHVNVPIALVRSVLIDSAMGVQLLKLYWS